MSPASPPFRATEAAVGLVIFIASVALFLHLSSTDTEFSRYNFQWNGTSQVFDMLEGYNAVMVRDPAMLRGRQDAVLLMIAPARAPTTEEGTAYRDFVAAGNTLVLADDFGAGNEVLKSIGAISRFERGNLASFSRQFEISYAPVGYPIKGQRFVGDLTQIVFNHPVAVSGGSPLINTTHLSWIDTDGDGRVDRAESLNALTVGTEEAVGAGRVIVIGDASLFINAMQGLPDCDNDLLMGRLIQNATFVDQNLSQTAVAEGPISTFLWVREIPSLVVVVTTLSLGVIAWSLNRRKK